MKTKINWKKIFKKIIIYFLWALAGIAVFIVTLILGVRFLVLPKVAMEYDKQGKTEIASFIRENNNLKTITRVGTNTSMLLFKGGFDVIGNSVEFLKNGGIDFLKGLDEKSLKAAKELLDDLSTQEGIITSEETPPPTAVAPSDSETIPPSGEEALPTTADPQENTALTQPPASQDNTSDTPTTSDSSKAMNAYDRISRAASKEEMQDGLRIIGMLDTNYISSLISGGLTPAEKAELKKYVYATLSQADVRRALELYQKYKKYL